MFRYATVKCMASDPRIPEILNKYAAGGWRVISTVVVETVLIYTLEIEIN